MMEGAGNVNAEETGRCVFFDRDGIVNVSPGPGYVETVDAFHLNPGIVEALQCVRQKGCRTVLITNQRGVGRGIMSQDMLDQIHAHMQTLLQAHGVGFDDICVCTDTDNRSPRRKPNPGMILEAAAKHGLDLPSSWMIGDSHSDILAGQRAGCRTILVNPELKVPEATHTLTSVEELPVLLSRIL